ncbi:hypothetical protein BKA62DRAFT_766924 [Auriculariales sp. MPI-PUGE-AT-0066]|nr:hypothetical protein BKA62DRAFT_766924 [Auriculariales sp. MPI-PUGE-AT-0066]
MAAVSKPRALLVINLIGMFALALPEYAALLNDLAVFALSAHVNSFHGFFYVADLFPFAMSIITFVIVGGTLLTDFKGSNPLLSRPMLELPWLGVLAVLWLCINAFSSSRWRYVQAADCATIPVDNDLSSVTVWCKEVQALRSFVWIEWVIVLIALFWLWRHTSRESARGNRHVWSTSFARPPKTSFGHVGFDGARRSVGGFSTGRASSFHSGEDGSRYSTQSQPIQNDFEKESAEHWNNTHNEYVPRHGHSGSGGSSNHFHQGASYGNQPAAYGNQPMGYGNEPLHPNYGYSQPYPQHQQQPSNGSQQGGYIFDGFGHAR